MGWCARCLLNGRHGTRFKGQYGRAWGAGQERLHRGVFQLFHFVTGVLCWNVTQWPGSTPTAPLEAKKPMESKVCQPHPAQPTAGMGLV